MTVFDHDTIKIIKQIINSPVADENYEQIHGALCSAKKQMIPRQELISKYLELAAFHNTKGDLRRNIEILEEARELGTSDYPVVYQIAKSLTKYWNENAEGFCGVDLIWLTQYLQKVDGDLANTNFYHALRGKLGRLYSLINKVNNAETQLEQVAETTHTFFLSQLTTKQYEDLTPDERTQRVAEILARKLRKMLAERQATDAKEDSNAS